MVKVSLKSLLISKMYVVILNQTIKQLDIADIFLMSSKPFLEFDNRSLNLVVTFNFFSCSIKYTMFCHCAVVDLKGPGSLCLCALEFISVAVLGKKLTKLG